ncbi:adenylate/guanylate cyclase domain-containing protein [Bdellovibrio sp. HCB337]|uniref:adenylate/guanylate cyclase domain-containing protein n=1 Tax=Bdellovibrio sp. HCB337 TaxID=3394358 RepID=UPI0039A6911A
MAQREQMSSEITTSELREFEVMEEIRSVIRVVCHWMTIPLFLVFWIADWVFYPEYKWPFLGIRLLVIPTCLLAKYAIDWVRNFSQAQTVAVSFAIAVASCINAIILMIPDPTTPYYAGLNMVAVGSLSFIPFNKRCFTILSIGIFLPYYLNAFIKMESVGEYQALLVNSFFCVGSMIICFLIRHFNESLRIREIHSRMALKSELANRDRIIHEKTNEAVRLNTLSSQFSPQVVRAIREGRVDLEKGVHRAQICAIFVDIVGSTERVVRLDQQKVDKVLARFMDTVVSTFLKYDLTIDKFQGDGILAFANDPIQHRDFVQRTCYAALEVRELLHEDREFYLMNWKKEMQIRMGISVGYANVGFYGNKKFFRSYTAIGAPLPLASRLTNLAEPDQILIDCDVAAVLEQEQFSMNRLGERVIKGFEGDQNIVFELVQAPQDKLNSFAGSLTCPHHPDTVLFLDTNEKGHYEMKCRHCDFALDQYSMEILGQIPQMKAKAS